MRILTICALALLLALPARAQSPITIVVGFTAGGPSDMMARLVAPELSQRLGAPVVVRNATGAAGTIGAHEVARARPDGTTLLMTPVGPMVIQPHFRRDLPYTATDFTPICQVADTPVVLMTTQNGPRNLAALAAQAREGAGRLNYASTGPGTIPHIAAVALARALGVEMTHISYRGNADAVAALLRGDVTIFADQPGTLRAHNLHAISTFAEARTTEFAQVPTMVEQGHALTYGIWSGLFGPANMAPDLVARIDAACQAAMRSPSVVAGFERLATPIVYRDAAAFRSFRDAEFRKFESVIREAGLRPGD